MDVITQRDLRNRGAAIMNRVEAGETFLVTRNGNRVAILSPVRGPRREVPIADFFTAFEDVPDGSYAQLRADADEFFGDEGDRLND